MSSAFIPLSRRADKWHSRAPELYPVWSIDGITQWKRLLYIYIYICILCVAMRRSREWLLWSDEEWPRRRICSSRNRQRGLLLMLLLLLFFSFYFFLLFLYLYSSFSFFFRLLFTRTIIVRRSMNSQPRKLARTFLFLRTNWERTRLILHCWASRA